MRAIIEPPPEGEPAGPLWRRLAWFAGLAIAGAGATAAVAYALRALLRVG
ncbi:MAG: hypothetical protein WCY15_16205 [Phenylobacterium sp.]|nr:hypothetical protein [Phenylobacterium sp.]MDD3836980.1 hypothetical protein [Phenylobacterium sp.]MDX9998681.1 hypothetical protein [Phenylobacterium sp.]